MSFVYGLYDPIDERVRYVGITTRQPSTRLIELGAHHTLESKQLISDKLKAYHAMKRGE